MRAYKVEKVMKKKISLILILLLVAVLAVTLFACNRDKVNPADLPDVIDPNGGGGSSTPSGVVGTPDSLRFYNNKPNSVFQSMDISSFDLEKDIEWSVIYADSKGNQIGESERQPMKLDYIVEADRPKLSVKGHHMIAVKITVEGVELTGSFQLHLMENAATTHFVNVTIVLNGGSASFGTTKDGKVTISIAESYTIESWTEFNKLFTLSKRDSSMHYALAAVTYMDGEESKTLNAEGGFPFTLAEDITFNAVWTEDVLTVTFNLNLPAGATYPQDGEGNLVDENNSPVMRGGEKLGDPAVYFAAKYGEQQVQRRYGRIIRPTVEDFNVYSGLYFGGWYTGHTESVGDNEVIVLDNSWNFNATVEDDDIALYAKWNEQEYSFTLNTMGGHLDEQFLRDDVMTGVPNGMTKITGKPVEISGALTRIDFSGLKYNVKYTDYIVELELSSTNKVLVRFADLYDNLGESGALIKGDGSYMRFKGLYSDYACTQPLDFEGANKDYVRSNGSAYVGWEFDMPEEGSEFETIFTERISKWYTEILVKDKLTRKADGTVRIDQCMDEDVNVLIVPANILIDGISYPVSEIADGAIDNMTALNKLDLTYASNLTTIGARAFYNSKNLKEVAMTKGIVENKGNGESTVKKLTSVGYEAFGGTAFERDFYSDNAHHQFIIFNDILYKYVGPADKTDIVLKDEYYGSGDGEQLAFDASVGEDIQNAYKIFYNSEIAGVKSIMKGAFEKATNLSSLTLTSNVASIGEGAFQGLKQFKKIDVTANTSEIKTNNSLTYISENAFDPEAKILNFKESGNNMGTGSIVIGNVYYRFVNTAATDIQLPESIFYIAPYAFRGCTRLRNITFQKDENIEVIGRDAFNDTAFIRRGSVELTDKTYVRDGVTVINNMVVAHYGTSNQNVVLDGEVTVNEYAFGRNSNFVQSVRMGANVKEIRNYAFYQAKALKTIILNEIEVAEEGNTLVNAPAIAESAFLNPDGSIIDGLKIYVRDSVMNLLASLQVQSDMHGELPDDETTLAYLNLYSVNPDLFDTEEVTRILIDDEVVDKILLDTNVTDNPFTDRYGADFTLENALHVYTNTGVARTENLTDEMIVAVNKIAVEEEFVVDYDLYYIVFKYQDVLYKTYSAAEYTPEDEALEAANIVDHTGVDFVFEVYSAIQKNKNDESEDKYLKFSSSANYEGGGSLVTLSPTNNLSFTSESKTTNYLLKGLDSDEGTPLILSTTQYPYNYWSTHPTFDLVFEYVDLDGHHHEIANHYDEDGEIDVQNIEIYDKAIGVAGRRNLGRLPRTLNDSSNATPHSVFIDVNFYGLGVIEFAFNYVVHNPRYSALEQQEAISMPLNANATRYFESTNLLLKRQNGQTIELPLVNGNGLYFDVENIDTTTVGLHTLPVRYTNAQVANDQRTLTLDLSYIVTVDADVSLFKYEITKEYLKPQTDAYGRQVVGSAAIIGPADEAAEAQLKAARTIVIPSVYTEGDLTYEVTAIGRSGATSALEFKGVFEGYTNLISVHLSENIEYIYARAFRECTALRDIYTAASVTTEAKDFDGEYDIISTKEILDEAGEIDHYEYEVKIKSVRASMYEDKYIDGTLDRIDLAIEGSYELGVEDPNNKTGKDVIKIAGIAEEGIVLPEPKSKDVSLNVYLPDSVYGTIRIFDYNSALVDSNNANVYVWYYDVDNYKFRFFERTDTNLAYIETAAFAECSALDSINLTESPKLYFIGASAFAGSALKSIDLTGNPLIREINSRTFANNVNLETVLLYSDSDSEHKDVNVSDMATDDLSATGIEVIGEAAFTGCTALSTLKLFGADRVLNNDAAAYISTELAEANLKAIEADAFNQCSSLTEIYLWKGITTVADGVFTGCRALTVYLADVTVADRGEARVYTNDSKWANEWDMLAVSTGNLYLPIVYKDTNYVADDGNIYIVIEGVRYALNPENKEAKLAMQRSAIAGEIIVPASIHYTHGVTTYAPGAADHSGDYNVTAIGARAFSGNKGITGVTVAASNNLYVIDQLAFAGCENLQQFVYELGDDDNHLTYVDSTAFSGASSSLKVPQVSPVYTDTTGFRYSLNASTSHATVTAYVGSATNVTVPSTVNYLGRAYTVIGIDSNAFNGKDEYYGETLKRIQTITLANTITNISANAFNNLDALTAIKFADGGSAAQLVNVADYAFSGCDQLNTFYITYGNMVYELGESGKTAKAIKYIGYATDAFEVPEKIGANGNIDAYSVNEIADNTFVSPIAALLVRHDITVSQTWSSVTSNGAIYYIDDEGIRYSLSEPEGDGEGAATVLGFNDGFSGDTQIAHIEASIRFDGADHRVTTVAPNAFSYDDDLDEIDVRNADGKYYLQNIGALAFAGCTSLTDIWLPEGMVSIAADAFDGCYALSINANFAADSMSDNAWANGNSVVYNSGTKENQTKTSYDQYGYRYEIIDGVRYALKLHTMETEDDGVAQGSAIIARQPSNYVVEGGALTINKQVSFNDAQYNVIGIAAYAFSSNITLTSISLPAGLQYIKEYAFLDCISLTQVTIPENNAEGFVLSEVDEHAFDNTFALLTAYYSADGILYEMTVTGERNASVYKIFAEGLANGIATVPAAFSYLGNEYTVMSVKDNAILAASGALNAVKFEGDLTISDSEVKGFIEKFKSNEEHKNDYGLFYLYNHVFYKLELDDGGNKIAKVRGVRVIRSDLGNVIDAESREIGIAVTVSFGGVEYSVNEIIDGAFVDPTYLDGNTALIDNLYINHDVTISHATIDRINIYFYDSETNLLYLLKVEKDGGVDRHLATVVSIADPEVETSEIIINATQEFGQSQEGVRHVFELYAIGEEAFINNTNITKVTVKQNEKDSYNLTTIGERAFANCTNLAEFAFEGGNESNGGNGSVLVGVQPNAFLNCPTIKEFYIIENDMLYSIKYGGELAEGAVGTATALKYVGESEEVTIAEEIVISSAAGDSYRFTVTTLGGGAFRDTNAKTAIVFSDIAVGTEANAIKLYYVDREYGAKYLLDNEGGLSAKLIGFSGDSLDTLHVRAVILFDGGKEHPVKSIEKDVDGSAFSGITELMFVYIHAVDDNADIKTYNLEKIGESAFENCSGLVLIQLPATVTSVGANAFAGCPAATIFCSFDESAAGSFGSDWAGAATVVYTDSELNTRYYIDELTGVRYILYVDTHTAHVTTQSSALSGEVVIPDTIRYEEADYHVTEIDTNAFNGNSGVTGVTIPSTLQKIGENAFANCSALESVAVSGFEACALSSVAASAYDSSNLSIFVITSGDFAFLLTSNNTAIILNYFGSGEDVEVSVENNGVQGRISYYGQEYTVEYVLGTAFALNGAEEPQPVKSVNFLFNVFIFGEVGECDVYYTLDGYKYHILNVAGEDDQATLAAVPDIEHIVVQPYVNFNNAQYTVSKVDAITLGESVKNVTLHSLLTQIEVDLAAYTVYYSDVINGISYSLDHDSKTATAIGLVDREDTRSNLTIINSVVLNMYGSGTSELSVATYTVTAIGDNAFENNANVRTVNLSASIARIGAKAFAGTTKLDAFIFASGDGGAQINNLEYIAPDAFLDSELARLNRVPAQKYYNDEENGIRYELGSNDIGVNVAYALGLIDPADERTEIVIIGSITLTFNVAEGSDDITYTYTVTEIAENAFANNEHIASVTVPASLTAIKANAFANTTALSEFKLATDEEGNVINNLKEVDASAFDGSALPEESQPKVPTQGDAELGPGVGDEDADHPEDTPEDTPQDVPEDEADM